jgi:hypothetical protein
MGFVLVVMTRDAFGLDKEKNYEKGQKIHSSTFTGWFP